MSRAVARWARLAAAVGLVSACAGPSVPDAELRAHSCEYAIAERGTSGSAAIELQGDEVVKVSVFVSYTGLPGRPGYSCTLEAGRDDPAAGWTRRGSVTEIAFSGGPPGLEDLVVITGGDLEFVIDLSNAVSSDRCGAGAELPERLTIPRAGGMCGVTL